MHHAPAPVTCHGVMIVRSPHRRHCQPCRRTVRRCCRPPRLPALLHPRPLPMLPRAARDQTYLFRQIQGMSSEKCWLLGFPVRALCWEVWRPGLNQVESASCADASRVHLAAQPAAVEPSREVRRTSAPLASSADTSASRPRPAAAMRAVAPANWRSWTVNAMITQQPALL